MIKYLISNVLFFCYLTVAAQPNCEVYKYNGETKKYQACIKLEEADAFYQFSKEFQEIYDEAIAIDSTFAYAYKEKSVAYLKSGDFITWKKLMDKAVQYDAKDNLGYRGWCRYQFFRDYQGAIADLEKLDSLLSYDMGYSKNGTYHLNIAKGLCYKGIGEKEKALTIIENQIKLNEEIDFVGTLDYLHLGVLHLELNHFKKAIEALKKQETTNNLAENQYYLALTYKALKRHTEYQMCLVKAKALYIEGKIMNDPYTTPIDKIYLKDIETELTK
ncbi:hypothetical protein Celal_0072 [Cellulophaga algicola DSM 14237]|uniref:Tetratricopeptide TPR_1 repeat-containing protein n=1 Tax=Cellulophaga algicola (strain DSM 14237 / IC166 / ACAM 630) TaxID=688270 RepID=E6X6D0_CELAD|nr:hypothetical protein [Cellulophaga algicola]ADV47430.1 hypothetical protein Celal_0072 [Cellulophaga algicola DSM 14237]